jgi:hypothetical protein
MTNLTEQWKKGELPFGWYYIKIADIVFIDFFEGKVWKNKKDEYIDEVLAEVPSFEQWFNQGDYVAFLEEKQKIYGKLHHIEKGILGAKIYFINNYDSYPNCRRLTKQEIEEIC